jgi:hypothetical protein
MAQVPVTLAVMIYPKNKTVAPYPATLVGYAWVTGLTVGGGPVEPAPIPPDTPGIWPPDRWINAPEHPIVLPPDTPVPPDVPMVPSEPKPPPPNGGWGWSPDYGWGYFPGPGGAGPKR